MENVSSTANTLTLNTSCMYYTNISVWFSGFQKTDKAELSFTGSRQGDPVTHSADLSNNTFYRNPLDSYVHETWREAERTTGNLIIRPYA
jgi:hypothetical protein